jgi:hypothetical protein
MAEATNPGEDKAWEILAELEAAEVCKNASASFDARTGCYLLRSFGMDFSVSVRDKNITSAAGGGEILLTRLGYFFRLSVLRYLAGAKRLEASGELVKLERLKGGEIFTRGSHALPLDAVAEGYARDKGRFLEKGKMLGGEPVRFGDAGLRLFPLPRVPAVLSLWLEDEEFPARLDLLFDSSCERHLATDVIWSVAMTTVLIMQ